VGSGFHDQTVDAYDARIPGADLVGDVVLSRAIGVHDRADKVLGYEAVVGQQLFGVLGQAVATVAEARIVVVPAAARIEAYALGDLARVQTVGAGVGVQLVEVGNPHGQVGIGKQLDRLGLGRVGEQHRDVLGDSA